MQDPNQLPKSTPEAAGIPSEAILAFIQAVEEPIYEHNSLILTAQELHSFTLLRHGKIVAEGWWEPFSKDIPHILFSSTKSFTSTAVGLAIDEGKISLDDLVISFFPDDLPPVISENLANLRVRHLLTMSSGHIIEDLMDVETVKPWVQIFFEKPLEYPPGTHFQYNTAAANTLAAIVEKVSGESLADYLQSRLFNPLGIAPPSWEINQHGIIVGGTGLSLTTTELALFGQLYLQKGVWNGQRLLSEEWVEMASSKQVNTSGHIPTPDWLAGYGFQFWRCQHNAYRADGAFGQYCIVMPEQDAVMAINAGILDMQIPLNIFWKYIFAAMEPKPLPPNPSAANQLTDKLSNLKYAPLKSIYPQTDAVRVSGQKYRLSENLAGIKSISFDFNDRQTVIHAENSFGRTELRCGNGVWLKGETSIDGSGPRLAAASGSWVSRNTFFIRIFFLTNLLSHRPQLKLTWLVPFSMQITCQFNKDGLVLAVESDISFVANRWPLIHGYLVG
ncbi:MAG: serine hydrolase [Chloroflexi bacterium]|nr:serine hydrolase [Chloroflexota bacterium]OJW05454.1 MAG: hypothetical protein BGO39_15840 [Chloroflexi bacterium 54-19]